MNPTSSPLYVIQGTGQLQPHVEQEFLLTNGLGAFSSSTVAGCNTRRYHSLLIAATQPPLGRINTIARVGEILYLDGRMDQLLETSVNQFAGGNYHPSGQRYLRSFELGRTAKWIFDVDGVQIVKELQLVWGENVAGLRYTVRPDRQRPMRFELLPFAAMRDFHALRKGTGGVFNVEAAGPTMRVEEGSRSVFLRGTMGTFVHQPLWWQGHRYAVDAERGQDHVEDLLNPGRLVIESGEEFIVELWMGLSDPGQRDFDAELARRPDPTAAATRLVPPRGPRGAEIREAQGPTPDLEAARRAAQELGREAMGGAGGHERPIQVSELSPLMKRLYRAAADFVVRRNRPDGKAGTTILAGYPWFADWGRDTMISLPGLLLATGRFSEARQVLTLFAQYVSEGMIPNRFDDYTNEPSYNTVDASLWFVHACHEYRAYSADGETFERALAPACREVLRGYRQGTRFGIRMDEADGLIEQGDASTQLTWMDAKMENVAFTPRQGKPVEINALWYNALRLMGEEALAERVAESFRKAFWISPFRGLADVVRNEGSAGRYARDAALRPNQIFAVSLPHSPLSREQQSAVVETVRRELLTPMGLRTLNKGDRNYKGRYTGNQWNRDAAYHNGTAWAWLIGPFVEAHLQVNDFSAAAREQGRKWLMPLIEHMADRGCIGQIAECFDGDEPQRPVGTPAQAWSVAEVLRVGQMVGI